MIIHKAPMQTNLESFLDCVTAAVPSQSLSKTEMRNLNRLWQPREREKVEYFTLADFWKRFDEWSAYGVGVPISLDNGETLIQYFVPYLSAIQIFTSNPSSNCLRDETESSCETRDSFSDSFSDDSEFEKLSRWDGSSSEDGVFDQDGVLNSNERLGYLYFQYFERSTPYGRVSLFDKINSLAQRYPGLVSLRSVDLSPASWISVAWYPIYHIPMGHNIKDLSTCFLTYHTLSSSFQDTELEDDAGYVEKKPNEGEGIRVPPFGLASYKMYGDVWISNQGVKDQERLVSLSSVANSWLMQLGIQHHDFNYFMGIRHG